MPTRVDSAALAPVPETEEKNYELETKESLDPGCIDFRMGSCYQSDLESGDPLYISNDEFEYNMSKNSKNARISKEVPQMDEQGQPDGRIPWHQRQRNRRGAPQGQSRNRNGEHRSSKDMSTKALMKNAFRTSKDGADSPRLKERGEKKGSFGGRLNPFSRGARKGSGKMMDAGNAGGDGSPGLDESEIASPHLQRALKRSLSSKGISSLLIQTETSHKYDLFLSHLQRNGQDAVISMRMFLEKAVPSVKIITDLEVDMTGSNGGGLSSTLRDAVRNSGAVVFFITDGIFESEWCVQELRFAKEFNKKIVVVRETDEKFGGIEMAEVFNQAPADLCGVIQEVVAIPWYRQPAYRDVSIQSILKAADVEDAYTKDMKRLYQARKQLESVYKKGTGEIYTAFDFVAENSLAMRIVFFLGGFCNFHSKFANMLYAAIFSIAFWACGFMCLGNMYYQATPYHVISTDMLTAYMHIPAYQSWRFWRKFVKSDACNEILTVVMDRDETAEIMRRAVRMAGLFVIFVQVSMGIVVVVGYAMPGLLGYDAQHAWPNGHPTPAKWPSKLGETFVFFHYMTMSGAFPIVIAAMFASYSMFAFVALLHWVDVQNLKLMTDECTVLLTRFYQQAASQEKAKKRGKQLDSKSKPTIGERKSNLELDDTPLDTKTSRDSAISSENLSEVGGKVEDLTEAFRRSQQEETLSRTVIGVLDMLVRRVQARADKSCFAFQGLWLHLVFFSTCQMLAITNGIRAHVRDENGLKAVGYMWWWLFQDGFHFGCGFSLLCLAFFVLTTVTHAFQKVPGFIMADLRDAGCPLLKCASVHGLLASRQLGMHVLRGNLYVDVRLAVMLILALTVQLINMGMSTINRFDYTR